MEPKPEISHDISPYLLQYKDGTIHRIAGTEWVPPGFDPQTQTTSKDTILIPQTGVSARIYRPTTTTNKKLPIMLYFHGGAFIIASPGLPYYHTFCNQLVQSANIIIISVDYRRAPENPLPAAYDDSWAAFNWAAAHLDGNGPDNWVNEFADFNRLYLAGDSAGATLTHHIASGLTGSGLETRVKIEGMILIHPYFWGKDPIGSEINDPRREMVNRWWSYVCRSNKGYDDPFINPFSDGASGVEKVTCKKIIVTVAEDDVLKERGKYYYDEIMRSNKWEGKVEFFVSKGKGHVFHIFDADCQEAVELRNKLAFFINNE